MPHAALKKRADLMWKSNTVLIIQPRALATFSVFLPVCKSGANPCPGFAAASRGCWSLHSTITIFKLYPCNIVVVNYLVADHDPVRFGHPKAVQYVCLSVSKTVSRSLISSSRRWHCTVFGCRIRCWYHILRCIIRHSRTRRCSKNSRCNSVCPFLPFQQDFF